MTKYILIFLVTLFTVTTKSFAQKDRRPKPLEGKIFELSISEENTKKPTKAFTDVFKFKSGKASSDVMLEKYKFEKGEYFFTVDSTDKENIKIHFNVDMENDMKESLKWDGDIDEDLIDGKILWMKKDKIKKAYSFNGSIKMKR